jgi:hypothetical protein
MSDEIESKTVYFGKAGKHNTDRTLELAKARADELGIKNIVVATTAGDTALMAADLFAGSNLVVVTHSAGFREPDKQEMEPENIEKLEKMDVKLLTATHSFGGVGRAVRKKLGTYELEELIAFTLRTFGQGVKVGVEIALMAADAGLIRTDEEAIVIGGTDRGADTAVVLTPTHAQTFFDIRIHEIICKPR